MRLVSCCLLLVSLQNVRAQNPHHSQTTESKSRREFAQLGERFTGAVDLFFKEKNGPGSLCQGTVVEKNRLEPTSAICRTAIFTAAHCADDPFDSLELAGSSEFPASQIQVCIPRIYKTQRLVSLQGGVPKKSDSATLILDIPCESISAINPPPLAPVDEQGFTLIDTKQVILQKRNGKIEGPFPNPGGGNRIRADIRPEKDSFFHFYVPTPQGAAIVGGDSGGPVFDENGRLICPMARSSYEYLRLEEKLEHPEPNGQSDSAVDPFEVSCDRKAIQRLKAHLANKNHPDCKIITK